MESPGLSDGPAPVPQQEPDAMAIEYPSNDAIRPDVANPDQPAPPVAQAPTPEDTIVQPQTDTRSTWQKFSDWWTGKNTAEPAAEQPVTPSISDGPAQPEPRAAEPQKDAPVTPQQEPAREEPAKQEPSRQEPAKQEPSKQDGPTPIPKPDPRKSEQQPEQKTPRQPTWADTPQSGALAGKVLSQDYYCIKAINPVIVHNVPAGTPVPSDCYNGSGSMPSGGFNTGISQYGRGGIGGLFSNFLGGMMQSLARGQQNQQQTPPTQQPPQTPPTQPSTGTPPTLAKPSVAIVANPALVRAGEKATLTWASVRTERCVIKADKLDFAATTTPGGSTTTPALSETTVFSISCAGQTGTATGEVRVPVQ